MSARLSELLALSPIDALRASGAENASRTHRVGITGPPGAGKSSLIAAWTKRLLARGRRVGVLAVDPSSPLSGGSILGDRVRMEQIAMHPALFLRSVPSRTMQDGLCPNVESMLRVFEENGFDELILETVGVGQVDSGTKALVDTFVLVLSPFNGDVIQAMKAGILELADIIVVNKGDLPAAERMVHDIEGVLRLRRGDVPDVDLLRVSAERETGLDELECAIKKRARFLDNSAQLRLRQRQRYLIQTTVVEMTRRAMDGRDDAFWDRPAEEQLNQLLDELGRVSG